jgi:hypothetical protein
MNVVADVYGPLVLLAVLVAAILFMVRGAAPAGGGSGTSRLRRYSPVSSLGPFFSGLLAAIALGASLMGLSHNWSVGVLVGILIALLFFILRYTGQLQESAVSLLSNIFGALGLIILFGQILDRNAPECTVIPVGQRVIVSLIVVVVILLGGTLAWGRGLLHRPSLLSLFGALKMALFFSTPYGVSLLDLGWPGWTVSLVAALLFGFVAGVSPSFTIGFTGAVVTLSALLLTVSAGTACSAGPHFDDLAPAAGFIGLYAVAALVGRRRKKAHVETPSATS